MSNADLLARLRLETDVDDAIVDIERVDASLAKTGPAAAAASGPMATLAAETNAVAAASAKAAPAIQAATVATSEQAVAAKALGAAQAAGAGGLAATTKGAGEVAKATAAAGTAMGLARTAGSGLLALVGGPLGLGLMAATGVMTLFKGSIDAVKEANDRVKAGLATTVDVLEDLRKQAETTASETVALSIAMGESATNADAAAGAYDRQAIAAAGAARSIRDMTLAQKLQDLDKSEKQLADLQAANRTTGLLGLVTTDNTEKAANARQKLLNGIYGSETQRRFTGRSDAELVAEARSNRANLSPKQRADLDSFNAKDRTHQVVSLAEQTVAARIEALKSSINLPPAETPTLVDEIVVTGKRNKKGRTDRQGFNAGVSAKDAAADVAAENARTAAIIAGGKAIDAHRISEAGRQAVEKVGLADKPKLTAAETALVASIRSSAEQTERLKIANERIEKAVGLARSADADTAALQRRAVAATKGQAALEQLQIEEAGLQVLQQLGVKSLDDLSGKAREYAEAAITSAKAAEAQGIAAEKASRVATQVRDLDKRIDSEKRLAVAKAGGLQAEVEYAQAEAIRQEIERAGTTLTDDQVAALTDKVKALFAVSAAADEASLVADQAEELRLARLTNKERDLEQRVLQRIGLIKAQHLEWTKEEVEARARALALADQAAADDAKAIGDLREGLKDAFVSTGKLAFDNVADYAEQRLRAAVYETLLAKPFDIMINAVVGSLGIGGLGGGSAAGGGAGGLASMFSASGSLKGLTTGSAALATKGLSALGMGGMDAARYGAMAGTAIGGAGTGMLVSSVAGMLGLKQTKGNQISGAIGGAIGSFIPIPGGTLIGSAIGNLLGGLVGGKKSNEAAVLDLNASGQVTNIGGAKRTDETTTAAQSIATAVAQIQAALVAGGATLGATVSKIDIGQRDSTHLNFSNGTSVDSAVGDVSAAVEAATKAIVANAKWATEAQTAYAQKMIAAGATLDQVIGVLQAAGGFGQSIDDAIQQLVDPAAYEKKAALDAIEANYAALKAQAQELIDAGLSTGDVLAKIDRLKDLQVDDALKRLAGAADSAAQALDPAAFAKSVQDGIASLTDPTGFARAQALADINASIAAMRQQAVGLVASGKLTSDVFAQLDQLKDLKVADSIKKLGDAASDAAAALAADATKSQAAQDFKGGIDAAIAQLLDPTGFERTSALDAINASYQAMRDQALQMVAGGLLSGDVLAQLDRLRDLQVGDSIAKLGDAASDAAAALAKAAQDATDATTQAAKGADFKGSIGDALLGIVNPAAAKVKSATDKVQADYQQRMASAQALLTGSTLTDVVSQIETLRSLELDQVLGELAGAATSATDAFAEARPRLRAWLDGAALGGASPLNASEQRQSAYASYDRMMGLARNNDANALSQITTYADRLLAADSEATSSASDRKALFDKISADLSGLMGMGLQVGTDPVVTALAGLDEQLAAIAAYTNPAGDSADIPRPVDISNLLEWSDSQRIALQPQTVVFKTSVDELGQLLVKSLDQVRTSASTASTYLVGRTDAGFGNVVTALASLVQEIRAQAMSSDEAAAELRRQQAITNAYVERATANG